MLAQSLANALNVENAVHLGIHNAFPGVNFSENDLDALTVFGAVRSGDFAGQRGQYDERNEQAVAVDDGQAIEAPQCAAETWAKYLRNEEDAYSEFQVVSSSSTPRSGGEGARYQAGGRPEPEIEEMIMNNLILSLLLAAAIQPRATFNMNPAEQAAATKTHDQIALKLAPSAKQKLQRVAQSLANAPNVENAARLGIINAFPGVNFSEFDISALVMFVIWEVSRDADNDLKNLMDEMNKINEKKAALRNATDAQSDLARRKLDNLNEMSKMTSLRLQMMMDRRSKFTQTLSNHLKKQSDTASSIVQHLE